MGSERELTLRPIGSVVEGGQESAEIEIDAAWAEALDGIEDFSHIWILWWLDRFETPPTSPRVHPERREELPLVGLFATRSPHRPCPIAMTAVRLVKRQGRRLQVGGLEAYTGTPVLDIKPYLRRGDLIPEASMPAWLEQLWEIHDRERADRS
jgi:tRNA-Thr(GGU) m(6)t(6)A37 methyltransferase TsaA